MNSLYLRLLIGQLSKSTRKKRKSIIKSFLSGTYKSDYDRVMTTIDRTIYVPKNSKDTVDNGVECSKLFNEAMVLSQDLYDEQRKEIELRREEIHKNSKNTAIGPLIAME